MITVTTISDLRRVLSPLRARRIGFVPTMGALHEGHMSLVRAARSADDTVVVSIFVNPTQFEEASDLERYPRTTADDIALAEAEGVDIVFLPDAGEMYPDGFATSISVRGAITESLEGAVRGPSHFDGVATVVAKLLLAVMPDAAYFGAKDAQQVVVVKRMVADLGIPAEIVVEPTSRDADGLARSSRNARLSSQERERALAVPRALAAVHDAVGQGEHRGPALDEVAHRMLSDAGLEVEYAATVDPRTLEPVAVVVGEALFVVAVRVGTTRLIDNTVVRLADVASNPQDISGRLMP